MSGYQSEAAMRLAEIGVQSLWHMTHRDNVPGILARGILSHLEAHDKGCVSVDISNASVQQRRGRAEPCYGRQVHAYAPLYFNPRNPMLYSRLAWQHELCMIEVSVDVLEEQNFVLADGNAASGDTRFVKDAAGFDLLSWEVIYAERWNGFADGKRLRCAEALVHPGVSPHQIIAVHCLTADTQIYLAQRLCRAERSPNLYFG